jgi:hypothetical protein
MRVRSERDACRHGCGIASRRLDGTRLEDDAGVPHRFEHGLNFSFRINAKSGDICSAATIDAFPDAAPLRHLPFSTMTSATLGHPGHPLGYRYPAASQVDSQNFGRRIMGAPCFRHAQHRALREKWNIRFVGTGCVVARRPAAMRLACPIGAGVFDWSKGGSASKLLHAGGAGFF